MSDSGNLKILKRKSAWALLLQGSILAVLMAPRPPDDPTSGGTPRSLYEDKDTGQDLTVQTITLPYEGQPEHQGRLELSQGSQVGMSFGFSFLPEKPEAQQPQRTAEKELVG